MDPSNILNKDLVELALNIAEASIIRLFSVSEPQMVWGPEYLAIVVRHPTLAEPVVCEIGVADLWKDNWGSPDDCQKIAAWKAEAAQREGKPTSELTLMCPWDHEPGDYLYPGGVVEGKLAIGCSGLNGWADETAAYIILDIIEGLCKRKREQLRENKIKQLL